MSKRISHTVSIGNVFQDLGYANPETAAVKAGLAREVARAIEECGLTQAAAGERVGLVQGDVSRIVNGRLTGFTVERLLNCLEELGRDVLIDVRPAAEEHGRIRLCTHGEEESSCQEKLAAGHHPQAGTQGAGVLDAIEV
jgi:predicted XRE-type DNA-binding protein